MVLSEENLIRVLDTLATRSGYAQAMAEVGAREGTAFAWLAKSRAAAKADDKASPFYIKWRERWGFFHEHAGAARREHILSTEAVIRQQVKDGVERKLFDGAGNPIWLVDPLAVSKKFTDAEEAEICGFPDWPFVHDENGARVQATERQLVPATTRNLILQTIPDYQPHSTMDVKTTAAVHVTHSYLKRPPEERGAPALTAPAGESDVVREIKDKLRAQLKPPTNPRPDPKLKPVQIFGRATGDQEESISTPSDQTGLPTTLADHPRAYEIEKPAPRVAPQPNFGRPAEKLDQASRGRGVPPVGGFKVR